MQFFSAADIYHTNCEYVKGCNFTDANYLLHVVDTNNNNKLHASSFAVYSLPVDVTNHAYFLFECASTEPLCEIFSPLFHLVDPVHISIFNGINLCVKFSCHLCAFNLTYSFDLSHILAMSCTGQQCPHVGLCY
jgi:hypothetical protein